MLVPLFIWILKALNSGVIYVFYGVNKFIWFQTGVWLRHRGKRLSLLEQCVTRREPCNKLGFATTHPRQIYVGFRTSTQPTKLFWFLINKFYGVYRPPYEEGFAYEVVFVNIAPNSAVVAVSGIVAEHKVILFAKLCGGFCGEFG